MRICSSVQLRQNARFLVFTFLLLCPPVLFSQNDRQPAPLTAAQVAARMEEKNQERARALGEFAGSRIYRMEYRGFSGNKDAEMTVEMSFLPPASKKFKVVSQSGSKLIIDHVFKKLLQSEQEAMDEENRRRTALTGENYEFALVREEQRSGGNCYVLSVTPRNRNKFLYQGTIWVNARDFAVTHIEAEPARSPSFWIKKTDIAHDYTKVGDFWLPARNRTVSQVRFGGHAILSIEYTSYKFVSGAAAHPGGVKTEPDPSAQPAVAGAMPLNRLPE
ncbi:MAG TPA: hypothetical protein VH724_18390 [Candidatus Angelobacter sp.]|nr:hypothetical protein [Candidatus Angelobacter sp.]